MSVEQPERGKCQQSQRGLPLMLQRTRTRNLVQRAHVLYMHAQRRGTSVALSLHAEMHHLCLPLCARVLVIMKNDKTNCLSFHLFGSKAADPRKHLEREPTPQIIHAHVDLSSSYILPSLTGVCQHVTFNHSPHFLYPIMASHCVMSPSLDT